MTGLCGGKLHTHYLQLCVKTTTEKALDITVGEDDVVEDVMVAIQGINGIPIDLQQLVLSKKLEDGTDKITQLKDSDFISIYGIKPYDLIHMNLQLRSGTSRRFYYVMDDVLLEPIFDRDFTNVLDDGTEFYRGGKRYYRPYGWKRYALKVRDVYGDNEWLGEPGHRIDSSAGEWAVAYYGTGGNLAGALADNSRGVEFLRCRGVFSIPSIDQAAEYAHYFVHKRKCYLVQLLFQCRVNTSKLIVFDAAMTGSGEFWVQPLKEFVCVYGVCIQHIDQTQF